jgi:hypothetical protein
MRFQMHLKNSFKRWQIFPKGEHSIFYLIYTNKEQTRTQRF